MIQRRLRFWLVAGLLVAGPFLVWAVQEAHDRLVLRRLARLDPPIAVLAEPAEDTARSPGAWMLVALRDRPLFARAAAFCRNHDDLPLPNCANLLVADRLLLLLPDEPLQLPDPTRPVDTARREAADDR